MILYSLSKDNSVLFATTDENSFLDQCVTLYDDVSDDTWPTYEDKSELPDIFASFGYVYSEKDTDTGKDVNGKAYTDLVILFSKISVWNPTFTYDNAFTLITVAQRLLIDYNEETLDFLADTTDNPSLIKYLAGDDGVKQWDFHKAFVEQYQTYIY